MKKYAYIFLSFFAISALLLSGCGCRNTATGYEVRLEIWGLFDDSDVMAKVLSEYKKRNPRVKEIVYKKLIVESYENDLMEALATGNGPDIFLVHKHWLPKHKDKLASVSVETVDGKQVEILNTKQVHDQFADVVSSDFVSDEQIYALPLSADSLALYYNKDYLNQAGITSPPRTWIEFDDAVRKITRIYSFGNITLSAAAMG